MNLRGCVRKMEIVAVNNFLTVSEVIDANLDNFLRKKRKVNKIMEFLPVFLTLLFWIKIEANQEFSFHQFENFVLNKETFNDEKNLVKQLGDLKAKLWELKEEIINRELSPNFRKVLVKLKEMKKTKKNFSSEQDLDGAFRGLILLQETYQLDPVFW